MDGFFLAAFTRASHVIQRLTGYTCYRQALVCTVVWRTTVFLDVVDYWFPNLLHAARTVPDTILAIAAFMVGAIWSDVYRRADASYGSGMSETLPAEAKKAQEMFPRWIRIACALMTLTFMPMLILKYKDVYTVFDFFDTSSAFFLTATAYLSIVRPLPRGPSAFQRVMDAIRSGLATPVTTTR